MATGVNGVFCQNWYSWDMFLLSHYPFHWIKFIKKNDRKQQNKYKNKIKLKKSKKQKIGEPWPSDISV